MAPGQENTGAQSPFSTQLLHRKPENPNPNQQNSSQNPNFNQQNPPSLTANEIQSLLPASYRKDDDVNSASLDVDACIKKELDLHRLHCIFKWMWVVGRPSPPRPLHYQLLLSREIFLTEQMDMHLVWTTGRMFLKPIPRFLLEPRFWNSHLASTEFCHCFEKDVDLSSVKECDGGLRTRALGFLFSYVALIVHESDFEIAQEKHLLPKEVTWDAWITFVKELQPDRIYDKIDERFKYGELRLSRLNKIYRFTRCPWLLGAYLSHWHQYGSFLQDNFTWLASTTVYIAIVLTAMQVGLALDNLKGNSSFVSASYGFTIFSILGPLVAGGLIIVAFIIIFIFSWCATSKFWKNRSTKVKLWEPVTKEPTNAVPNTTP